MNTYITGALIRSLREKKGMSQATLAANLNVSDKAVSKWETGKSYPDITLLDDIARVLSVSTAELLSGNSVNNTNISSNMLKCRFYVCPVCGNILYSMGEAHISCHGVELIPLEADASEDFLMSHSSTVTEIEGEFFVEVSHDMTKSHYISFLAAVSPDKVQIVKLYPEGNAEARLMRRGVKYLYGYCNKDGFFRINLPARRS